MTSQADRIEHLEREVVRLARRLDTAAARARGLETALQVVVSSIVIAGRQSPGQPEQFAFLLEKVALRMAQTASDGTLDKPLPADAAAEISKVLTELAAVAASIGKP